MKKQIRIFTVVLALVSILGLLSVPVSAELMTDMNPGGGENCPDYDVKNDSSVTCQQCGKPYGDGHKGTCYSEIDWADGGKKICHHYD